MKQIIRLIKKIFSNRRSFSSVFSDALNEGLVELGQEMGCNGVKNKDELKKL